MKIRVLGSAAGGAFPQWNCACFNCRGQREGLIKAVPRTQESVCLSTGDGDWILINASPDIRAQIESFKGLYPRRPRDTPIQAIFLTNGDLDHCLGLLSLRENQPIVVYATDAVREALVERNVMFRTLRRYARQVTWRSLKRDVEESVVGADGRQLELTVMATAVPGKPPVHLEGLVSADDPDLNVGLRFRQSAHGPTLAYLPAVGRITQPVFDLMEHAHCVFFDGTFWSSDELAAQGLPAKSAQEMAHWPVGGREGSLALLSRLSADRRVLIHINNTNPVLREDSRERKDLEAAGWEVAWDGMEIRI
jgi:pyrroloquinoline quinone biosynthesis protein B